MGAYDVIVALPLIRVDLGRNWCELMDVGFKGFSIRVMYHTQPHLTTRASNGTHNWRAVIGVRAMPFALVGSAAGRV